MFRAAVKRMLALTLHICPACGEMDAPTDVKQTLEQQSDGSFTCRKCGRNFYPPQEGD